LLRALPRSYQVTPDIPGPATSDTAKGGQTPTGADSLKESQLAAGPETISTASDITDTADHNSKRDSSRRAPTALTAA
jgi:hypothetical protein